MQSQLLETVLCVVPHAGVIRKTEGLVSGHKGQRLLEKSLVRKARGVGGWGQLRAEMDKFIWGTIGTTYNCLVAILDCKRKICLCSACSIDKTTMQRQQNSSKQKSMFQVSMATLATCCAATNLCKLAPGSDAENRSTHHFNPWQHLKTPRCICRPCGFQITLALSSGWHSQRQTSTICSKVTQTSLSCFCPSMAYTAVYEGSSLLNTDHACTDSKNAQGRHPEVGRLFRKPLKRAIWRTMGLHAEVVICEITWRPAQMGQVLFHTFLGTCSPQEVIKCILFCVFSVGLAEDHIIL